MPRRHTTLTCALGAILALCAGVSADDSPAQKAAREWITPYLDSTVTIASIPDTPPRPDWSIRLEIAVRGGGG